MQFLDQFFTIIGVIGGLIGIYFIARQTRASARAAKVTENEFHLSHRPRIIVRNIVIPGLKMLNRTTPMNQMTQQLSGYYTVANVGGLPATIIQVMDTIWIDKAIPMECTGRRHPGRSVSITLAPGEAKEISLQAITITVDNAWALINSDANAFFLVRIEYNDAANVKRETSACRRFDPDTQTFCRINNPDYEYAD